MNGLEPSTIAEFFERTVAARGNEPALGFIRSGELQWRTWQEVADTAASLAAELERAGVIPGDRVAHVSENRYEWIITDLALHRIAAVHVPIHVTLSGPQIAEQIRDSGAKLIFVSTCELQKKFIDNIPSNLAVVVHDDAELQLHRQPSAEPGAASLV